tara:strand:- start:820 stop:1143 length:324 start_codon:yes stop_codon:yes gene_type:complete
MESLLESLDNPLPDGTMVHADHREVSNWICTLFKGQQKIAKAFDEHWHQQRAQTLTDTPGTSNPRLPKEPEPTLLETAKVVIALYGMSDSLGGRNFKAAVEREESKQ